ncbi:MerR family transcriptional regulator [Streptomyces sp. B1866]|uniref:MerR family transcriptional regulator n=1 Tax=Streptomyces sp. B1866 TaxID=3075431 RepID=UPI00288E2D7B|nr:MerR family transcriptional regulator [Streptomyces sp. B1866]MDT3396214.1 MerR family transcriptional regulator [Streptomyces sp. B1866]
MSTMRISQLAERTGVAASTLRFYESRGLLPADRTPAGYRRYGEDAVERLAFIGAAKNLGLPLEEVAGLLSVWESGACRDVKADLRPRLAARLAAAEERAAELAAFTATLRAALEHLDALPDRPGRCDPQCGFLTPARPSPARATAGPGGGPAADSGGGPVDVALAPSRRAAEAQEQRAEQAAPGEPAAAGEPTAERWRTAPVACSLTGDSVPERVTDWHRALDGARRQDIPEGIRLTLPAARTAAVAELAAAEQGCCPFFDFRLHLDGPDLHLEVRAPAEGAALLAELFAEPAESA